MKLWELRSYDQVIKLEQERLVYQARLRSRFGRAWRRKAPVESLMPLRLARYGVPLADTAPAGLAAAGIEPALLPPAPKPELETQAQARVPFTTQPQNQTQPQAQTPAQAQTQTPVETQTPAQTQTQTPVQTQTPAQLEAPVPQAQLQGTAQDARLSQGARPAEQPEYLQQTQQTQQTAPEQSPWFAAPAPQEVVYQGGYNPAYDPEKPYDEWYEEREPSSEETGSFPIPSGPGRTRQLGEGGGSPEPDEEAYYQVFKQSINGSGYPTPREFSDNVEATFGVPLPDADAKRMVLRFTDRHYKELEEDHIA
jgi:hypothetical protein